MEFLSWIDDAFSKSKVAKEKTKSICERLKSVRYLNDITTRFVSNVISAFSNDYTSECADYVWFSAVDFNYVKENERYSTLIDIIHLIEIIGYLHPDQSVRELYYNAYILITPDEIGVRDKSKFMKEVIYNV